MKYAVSDGFPYYIELLGEADYLKLFSSLEDFELLETISEEKANYRFAPDKWNIKQIVGHLTDHERIMIYRILRISRKDTAQLAGYDQELFTANSRFNEISYKQILTDFKNVRASSISFIDTLSQEQLKFKGLVWKFEMSIEEFLKAVIGHTIHHMNIIKEKYLK
ncbi:MAG TPA: DinB family protein [Leptospiraceae bacterium]|nr:DinB family protein [Leptospiraceae bacterium]HMY68235.1 DinB family protein [Leptospiraceae bacterium]HMZ58605.1 DinB family protein [Leptospiraceae bacterium]HNF12566.1 DinB family protein [Leptospiraceae bacterium]HNH08046.1 DinB family protein [Leptospiraceae bacterium]